MKPLSIRFYAVTLVLFCCLTISVLPSCSRKESGPSGDGALGGKLVQHVPGDALFFFVTNTGTESYRSLKKSPLYGAGSRLSTAVEGALRSAGGGTEEDSVKIQSILDSFRKSGIITGDPAGEDIFEEVVILALVEEGRIAVAVHASAASGRDVRPALSSLVEAFRQLDLEVQEQPFRGVNGWRFRMKEPQEDSILVSGYAAASNDHIVLSTSQKLLENLFDPAHKAGLSEIRERPSFREALKGIPALGSSYSVAFLDMQKLAQAAPSVAALKDAAAATGEVPLDSVLFSGSYETSLLSDVSILTRPKSAGDQNWVEPFRARSTQSLLVQSPNDLFLYLGLAGGALVKFSDTFKESGQEQGVAESLFGRETTDGLKEVAVGLRASQAGSPFPDVIVAADTVNAESLIKSVEESLGAVIEMTGVPAGGWNDKELQGNRIRFINSPMGLGLYLAAAGNTALVASSESAMVESLKSVSGATGNLSSRLGARMQTHISREQPGILLHIDFTKVADIVESLEGTLAAFTGGANRIDPSQINDLRSMGAVAIAASYTEPLIKLHVETSASETKAR